MFCTKCGSQIPDDANFCPNCQARVAKPDAVQGTSNNNVYETNTTVHTNPSQSNLNSTPTNVFDFQKFFNNCIASLKGGCSVENLKFRLIGFIGTLLLLIGTFLPAVTDGLLGRHSASYFGLYGPTILIMAIITALLLLMKKDLFAMIPTGICVFPIFALIKYVSVSYGLLKLSIGFYVIIVAILTIIANFFLVKKNIHIIK